VLSAQTMAVSVATTATVTADVTPGLRSLQLHQVATPRVANRNSIAVLLATSSTKCALHSASLVA
jgi:hypothetical protein